jgi:hypothetical protein
MVQPVRLLCLLLCCALCAVAQAPAPQVSPPKPPDKSPANTATQAAAAEAEAQVQRGIELLCDAGNAAAMLEDRELAARLLLRVAKLLGNARPSRQKTICAKRLTMP